MPVKYQVLFFFHFREIKLKKVGCLIHNDRIKDLHKAGIIERH